MKGKTWMLIGFFVILLGILLNNFVVAQNGGMMPTKDFVAQNGNTPNAVFALHSSITDQTRWYYLTDIISIGPLRVSIADIVQWLGLIPLIIGLRKPN
jgi:uncharacterized membrane protein